MCGCARAPRRSRGARLQTCACRTRRSLSSSTLKRSSSAASCALIGKTSPFASRSRRGTRPRASSAASRCSADIKVFGSAGAGAFGWGRRVCRRFGLLPDAFSGEAAVLVEAVGCGVRSLVVMRFSRPVLEAWTAVEGSAVAVGMVFAGCSRSLEGVEANRINQASLGD